MLIDANLKLMLKLTLNPALNNPAQKAETGRELGFSVLNWGPGDKYTKLPTRHGIGLGECFDREKLKRLKSEFPRKIVKNR